MKVCVTGHRPDKLFGYKLDEPNYCKLRELFKLMLLTLGCTEAITGMALGTDTVFAQAVLELKEAGCDIKLVCAIPCLNHSNKWFQKDKDEYERILSLADEVVIVTEETYRPDLMQKRNVWMADRLTSPEDMAFALFNGTTGGTKNCVDYLKSRNTKIMVIDPESVKNSTAAANAIRESYQFMLDCVKAA